jgi:Predicted dehydrogenase
LKSNNKKEELLDVAIIGGGIVGTSLLFTLANFTGVKRIALFEKNKELGQGNSNYRNNSKTLHEGFAETNYSLEKMKRMKIAGILFRGYLRRSKVIKEGLIRKEEVFSEVPFFVLAINEEIDLLETKYEQIKNLFPEVKLLNRKEIFNLEPNIVKGRNKNERIEAIFKENGLALNFGNIAKTLAQDSLIKDKDIKILKNQEINEIKDRDDYFELKTNGNLFYSKFVYVSSSANSFYFAKKMGFLENFSLLNIRGNYYSYPPVINSKVYRVQIEKIPFVQIHADPNPFLKNKSVEFGPTAEIILSNEYAKDFDLNYIYNYLIKDKDTIYSIINIFKDSDIRKFIFKNVLYRFPKVGKWLFAIEAKKIVPKLNVDYLEFNKGGIRPQLVDNSQAKLVLGEKQFAFNNIMFAITPSPGASASILNSIESSNYICKQLDVKFNIDDLLNYFKLEVEQIKDIKLNFL